jgi:hypothetical protein
MPMILLNSGHLGVKFSEINFDLLNVLADQVEGLGRNVILQFLEELLNLPVAIFLHQNQCFIPGNFYNLQILVVLTVTNNL